MEPDSDQNQRVDNRVLIGQPLNIQVQIIVDGANIGIEHQVENRGSHRTWTPPWAMPASSHKPGKISGDGSRAWQRNTRGLSDRDCEHCILDGIDDRIQKLRITENLQVIL